MADTTTPEPTEDAGVTTQVETQPTEPVATEAATQEPATETTTEPSTDENSEWLKSKGIDPESPEAVAKIAEMYRNSEKQMTKATQEASELKKSLTSEQPVSNGADPVMGEFIADYKRDKMISTFKESHSDWSKHEPRMAELLSEKVQTPDGVFTRSQLVNAGYGTLEQVYREAKGSSPDSESIKSEAKQEVLQDLANRQRAGGATPNASNPLNKVPTGKKFTDMSLTEKRDHLRSKGHDI